MRALPAQITTVVRGVPVTLALRRSQRSKWAKVRALSDRLEVVLPPWATVHHADEIVERHKDWILSHHLQLQTRLKTLSQGGVWYLGRRYDFAEADGTPTWDEATMTVRAESMDLLSDWVWKDAASRLIESVERWSAVMGVRPSRVNFRDGRSRWGSCSTAGSVTLSPRLVMTPPECLEYVVVHELAHLRHPDHSPAFWAEVARHCPTHKAHEKWLKDHYAEVQAVFR